MPEPRETVAEVLRAYEHTFCGVEKVADAVLAALELRQEDQWVPVEKDGYRWMARDRELAEAALAVYSVDVCDLPVVDHIEHERRLVTPWVGVRDAEPVVDAPQDAPKPQTHVPARERSKPASWATVGANKARAKARKEREQ